MKLGPFTFTRDNALWLYGMLVALIGALATLDPDTALAFGISAAWLPKLRLLSFLIGVGSAWVTTSPLKHSQDVAVARVDLSKLAPVLLLCLLGAAPLALTACGSKTAPVVSPAQQAIPVLQRIDELQNAVIGANALTPGAIPDAVAVPLVRFCVEAAKVLKASPNGVLPAIAAEWRDLKAQVPLKYRQLPALAAAFVAVDLALAEVGVSSSAQPAPADGRARLKTIGATAAAVGIVAMCVAAGGGCGFLGGGAS